MRKKFLEVIVIYWAMRWNSDSVHGKPDLIQIRGETGQGRQRKISGILHICKCAVPGGTNMHLEYNKINVPYDE